MVAARCRKGVRALNPLDSLSVAHVVWSGNIGGIERLVCDLSREQVASGLNINVVFGSSLGPIGGEMKESGTKVAEFGFSRGFFANRRNISDAAKVLAASDVVHLHGYNFVFEAVVRASGRPVVFTEHGAFGHARRRTLSGRSKAWRKARFLRSVQTVVANSQHSAQRLAGLYGIDREAISVVYNGVVTDRNEEAKTLRPQEGPLRVALIGRLVDSKRPDLLIDALRLVEDPARFRVEIVGDGPLGPALRERTIAYGLTEVVRFVGWSSDVASILRSADVLVHPSEEEGFGMVIVEAALAGALPVVFADGGGVLEVIPPDARVVSDVGELAAHLDELIDSEALSSEARTKRVSWVRRRFPISQTARAYQSLYEAATDRGVSLHTAEV